MWFNYGNVMEEIMNIQEYLENKECLVEEPQEKMELIIPNAIDKSLINKQEKKENNAQQFIKVGNYCEIVNGDCLFYMKQVETHSIDLILTDPPYNLGKFMHQRKTNLAKMRNNHFAFSGWDELEYEDWVLEMDRFFSESFRVMRKGGTMIMFMSLMKLETIITLAQKHGFYYKTVGIWHKLNPMPRNMNINFVNSTEAWLYFVKDATTGTFNNEGKVMHDFVETSLTTGNEKKHGSHPTQKPEKLIAHFIKLLTNENEVILDCFMGSGTTATVSERLKRKFIGMEINEKYFNIATNRIKENIGLI